MPDTVARHCSNAAPTQQQAKNNSQAIEPPSINKSRSGRSGAEPTWLILYSNAMNPVVLPPGCAKLFTKPAPTGSATAANMTIPIVFNTAGDPVQMGLVASLNRPGGNVTGVANLHMQLAALLDQP
jgi:hypothetical protein